MTETNSHPVLSVVLSADATPDLLRRKLESLCAQTLSPAAFEVVVVDGLADGGTREAIAAFAPRLALRVEHEAVRGRAAARNRATLAARGDVVLFLDDDAIATPGLLDAHVAAHRAAPDARHAVLGATRLAPDAASAPLARFVVEVEEFPVATRGQRDGDRLEFTSFCAARCSCKRVFLLEHGLFDVAASDGCEDVELGYRLFERGLDLRYCAGAVTARTRPTELEAELAARRRHGAARRALASRTTAEPLRQWAAVEADEGLWDGLRHSHAPLVRSAVELDRVARLRAAAGFAAEPWEVALLHRGYWTALRIARAQGAAGGSDT